MTWVWRVCFLVECLGTVDVDEHVFFLLMIVLFFFVCSGRCRAAQLCLAGSFIYSGMQKWCCEFFSYVFFCACVRSFFLCD